MPDTENKDRAKFALMQKRLKQKIQRPVIIYRKKTGEVVRGIFSSKIEEIQKIDRRSLDVVELESGSLPTDINNYVVINGVFKKKPQKIIDSDQKRFLEYQLVALNTQLATANKNNLEEAKSALRNRIKGIKNQIKDLGVD